jgi:hypothetical protein
MARRDERRAASQFFHGGEPAGPVRPLTPLDLLARLAGRSRERRHRHDRIRSEFVMAAHEELDRRKPTDQGRSAIKEKEKGKSRSGDLSPKTKSGRRPYRQMMADPRRRSSPKDAAPDDGSASRAVAKVSGRIDLLALWRRVAAWITSFYRPAPTRPRPGYRRRNHRLLR